MKAIVSFLSAIIVLLSNTTGLFTGQVKTMQNIKKVEDNFYICDYEFDYDLDSMLKRGVNTHIGLFAQGFAEIFNGFKSFGCTTFNSVTKDGDYLFSRNFDYMDAPFMLVRTHPKNGYASISSVSLEFLGYFTNFIQPDSVLTGTTALLAPYAPLDGINEKGLAIGILELEKPPVFQISSKPNLTTTTIVRMCLDKAATVEEAVKIFKTHDLRDLLLTNCTYHYHIADAKGKSCVIEYIDGEINVIYPEVRKNAAVNYQVATNFYLTPGVDDPLGMGYERSETAYKALNKSKGVTSEKSAMNILKSCSMLDADLHGYICSTLWSNVFNCTDKKVNVVHFLNYDKVYTFSVNKTLASAIK